MTLPSRLQHLPQPVLELYQRGSPLEELLQRPCVAIVGSRKPTSYGQQVTHSLALRLARQGVTIISGLAFGVDSIAHRAALEADGATIAVLPCPLEAIYPASHTQLAETIAAKGGTLVTEYAQQPTVFKHSFIARNRIIAALADVVVVTEAAARSGSLHTAAFALELGKPVMAVPGPITNPLSAGTNELIKSGALPITSVDDIFLALGHEPGAISDLQPGNGPQQSIIDGLERGIHSGDELLTHSGLTPEDFNRSLILLEINGTIQRLANNRWSLG